MCELINLIINLLQAVKIGSLTKVHIVGHKSTFRGARKYILSATKVYGVKHGCATRNDGWLKQCCSVKIFYYGVVGTGEGVCPYLLIRGNGEYVITNVPN